MFKNVASQKITLIAWDTSANTYKTGDAANLTFYVNKDDAGIGALGDTSASELSSTNDPGSYTCDLTQGETNADKLRFSGKSSTSGVIVIAQTVYTLPPSFTAFNNPLTVAQELSGLGMASGNMDTQFANVATQLTGIDAKTTNLPATPAAVSDIPTPAQNADGFLARNVGGGSNSGQTVAEAFYFIHGNWNISSNTLIVRNPNTGLTSWQSALGTNSAAKPVISSTPA